MPIEAEFGKKTSREQVCGISEQNNGVWLYPSRRFRYTRAYQKAISHLARKLIIIEKAQAFLLQKGKF